MSRKLTAPVRRFDGELVVKNRQVATIQPGRRWSDMSRTKRPAQASRTAKARDTDQKLDEALKDTFPASDPVALTEPARKKPDKADRRKPASR